MSHIGLAVIGAGYWGPNLVRTAIATPALQLEWLCDLDEERAKAVLGRYTTVKATASYEQVLADPTVSAVAIATPAATHFDLVRGALEAGKHVLVEKPLTSSVSEAVKLAGLAERSGLALMCDHTYCYTPAVRRIRELIRGGEIGELQFVDSVRINLGLVQPDVDVLWDLAPHDLSIVDFLLGGLPRSVAAMGSCHTRAGQEDVAYLNLDFGHGLLASFHVNWLSPVKVRHLIIGGSNKGLVYNDLNLWEPIKVYDRGITVAEDPEARRGMLISYRTGDIWSPHVDQAEPLQNVIGHFADCIRTGQRPLTDGQAGLRVVRILEAAQLSIKAQGGRITL
jgi:predicted dehydrogenase